MSRREGREGVQCPARRVGFTQGKESSSIISGRKTKNRDTDANKWTDVEAGACRSSLLATSLFSVK